MWTLDGKCLCVPLLRCFAWFGKQRFSPGMVAHSKSFYSTMAYTSETIIFILSGTIITNRVDFDHISGGDWGSVVDATLVAVDAFHYFPTVDSIRIDVSCMRMYRCDCVCM